MSLTPESLWILSGVAGYTGSTVAAWYAAWKHRACGNTVLLLLFAGAVMLSAAVAERWVRVGYGPFLTLFEILLSNLASLGLIIGLVFWRVPLTRPGALVVLPVLVVLGIWSLSVPSDASRLPATYETVLLWIHVGIGKLFLAACLIAAGLAGVLLLTRVSLFRSVFGKLADEIVLDALAWRMMALAFVFHSLMLIAGAVWAQDAWGRYWAWDSLETSTFITWLILGLSLHLRLTWRLPHWLGWWLIIVVFTLAFLTFFGVPFVSQGPHKGML